MYRSNARWGAVSMFALVALVAVMGAFASGCTVYEACELYEREMCVDGDCTCGTPCVKNLCGSPEEACVGYPYDEAHGVCVQEAYLKTHNGELTRLEPEGDWDADDINWDAVLTQFEEASDDEIDAVIGEGSEDEIDEAVDEASDEEIDEAIDEAADELAGE